MLINKLNNKKKKKGFTLIELIVVLAVLAIIALIAIPNFNQVRENSKINADKRSCDLIEKAVETLIQEDNDTVKNGIYSYSDQNVTAPTGSDNNSITAIKGVLGNIANPQQEKGKSFKISVADVDTANPTVQVEVVTGTK